MKLLHGDLEIEVVSGENLRDKDKFLQLLHIIPGNWSDLWVAVILGDTEILTTGVRRNAINAVFGERTTIPVCEATEHLDIQIWDKDKLRSQEIGRGRVMFGDPEQAWDKDGPVYITGGKGRINMKIRYTPASQASDLQVPRTYFPMRQGGSVTFYQDAHINNIPGRSGDANAFHDILKAMEGAKKFIYISAWSLWTETRLDRDGVTLGEVLKRKASEGVRVLLLVWNEKFSAGVCAGLLNTFDERTDKYFQNTGVEVEKVRRKRSSTCAIKEKVIEAVWTHHQKTIVMDDGKGDLIAFLGGHDLTKGRWDTPDHMLFSTLSREHRGDFHNGYVNVKEGKGPREPWHDVHARVRGHVSIDVLRNFEERWRKQVPEKAHLLVQTYEEDLLEAQGSIGGADTSWEMQVLRSIDDDSAVFSSGRISVLDSTEGRVIDRSLHRGAVRVIRRAQRFIYIESQYFIGSAQEWNKDIQTPARNLVPLEIAEKIVGKIRKGEDFRAYILIPLMPEGNPSKPGVKCSIKSILHFQFLTIQMMYRKIGEALKEVGSDLHPTDYLLFFFLGKKESQKTVNSSGAQEPKPGSTEWEWRQKARFPIYVHSKLIIADDDTALVGSANLNQRSLDGTRDTEIAVIMREIHKGTQKSVTEGGVSSLRRSLWAEHTWGLSEELGALSTPSSIQAIREIKTQGDSALEAYVSGPSDVESRSRFMSYPLLIEKDGTVKVRGDLEKIPDFDIRVDGNKGLIPPKASV